MPAAALGKGRVIVSTQFKDPVPLFQDRSVAEPIPLDALGPLKKATLAISTLTQAPPAIAMQSVLAVASLAVQAFADVETLGGTCPASLFLLTVAKSGERKSACDRYASRAVSEIEARRLREYADKCRQFQARKRDDPGDDVVEGAWSAPESTLSLPLHPSLRLSDATSEGLFQQLDIGAPSVGLLSDEGGQVFGGYAMKRENKTNTGAKLSKLWDGDPIDRRRASSPPVVLNGRRASLHLMMQPGIAADVLGDRSLRDQGLLSRTLVVWPESLIGTRFVDIENTQTEEIAQAHRDLVSYDARITELLEQDLTVAPGTRQELTPRLLPLSEPARRRLRVFYNWCEAAQAPEGPFADIQGFASKAPEQVSRLAAVMTLFTNVSASEVDDDAMAKAVSLMECYLDEALRLLNTSAVQHELQDAQCLLDWLIDRYQGNEISLRDACRLGPHRLRNADTIKRLFVKLSEFGHLRPVSGQDRAPGRAEPKTWEIVRS